MEEDTKDDAESRQRGEAKQANKSREAATIRHNPLPQMGFILWSKIGFVMQMRNSREHAGLIAVTDVA